MYSRNLRLQLWLLQLLRSGRRDGKRLLHRLRLLGVVGLWERHKLRAWLGAMHQWVGLGHHVRRRPVTDMSKVGLELVRYTGMWSNLWKCVRMRPAHGVLHLARGRGVGTWWNRHHQLILLYNIRSVLQLLPQLLVFHCSLDVHLSQVLHVLHSSRQNLCFFFWYEHSGRFHHVLHFSDLGGNGAHPYALRLVVPVPSVSGFILFRTTTCTLW
mmetsp:Transcript_17404/g.25550  ORF Transcript_17404/g.25550 Transcript_17404/m.25550 type:complete len:213 (-) Transcript_17404:295-933(-)